MMGNSCTSALSAKAPQDTMETPPSRCETKEEPTACPASNRLNKEGNYAVPKNDAENLAMAPSTTSIIKNSRKGRPTTSSWEMARVTSL